MKELLSFLLAAALIFYCAAPVICMAANDTQTLQTQDSGNESAVVVSEKSESKLAKIIEKISVFFTKIIEKIKSFFGWTKNINLNPLVLRYPNLKENPTVGKWYRVTSSEMKSSDGSSYRAFIKKGSENKVLIYFAGGVVSMSAETAKEDMYNKTVIGIDMLANTTMNMGGLATASDGNPLKDWTVITFPYATGNFHAGTGDFRYTDNNGNEKILYHHGYTYR